MSAGDGGIHTLTNANRLVARVAPYGATLVSLQIPDRDGILGDVVLGLDDVAAYATQKVFLGATCGRVGNRIRDARFTLDGQTYALDANDPPHHLHGGARGWHRALWDAERTDSPDGPALTLTHVSPDGDAGYPGAVTAEVTYTLTHRNELRIDMRATTDRPTPINLVHHSYWNLAGGGTILDHQLTLAAEAYTPGDPTVPTGERAPVAGTPLDFRSPGPVWPDLDHNFVVDGAAGQLRPVAHLTDPKSGRTMTISSDQPGVQVYAGRFLDGSTTGRGVTHVRHAGICLETQAFPNAINIPAWRNQVLLQPGQSYRHTMVHLFRG